MPTINIAARLGQYLSSRAAARNLRNEVIGLAEASGQPVTLDFAGVEAVSDSFSDELVAVLVQLRGEAWVLAHVRIVNASAADRRDIESVIKRRAGTVGGLAAAFG